MLNGICKQQESERMPRATETAMPVEKQKGTIDHPQLTELSD